MTLFKAALAFRGTGDADREEQAWATLARRVGSVGLKLGDKEYPVAELRRVVAVRRRIVTPPPIGRCSAGRRPAPPTVAAMCRFSLPAPAYPPLGSKKRWSGFKPRTSPIPANGPGRSSAMPLPLPPDYRSTQTLLPVGVPIAVGNRIVFRGAGGVCALDANTGQGGVACRPGPQPRRRLGQRGPEGADRGLAEQIRRHEFPGCSGAERGAGHLEQRRPARLRRRRPAATAAATDDRRAAVRSAAPLRPLRDLIHHNRLRALDLTTGAVAWEIGGRAGAVPAELADVYFLGPPLPLASSLYALGEKQSELRLFCLSADTGAVLWTQTLATGAPSCCSTCRAACTPFISPSVPASSSARPTPASLSASIRYCAACSGARLPRQADLRRGRRAGVHRRETFGRVSRIRCRLSSATAWFTPGRTAIRSAASTCGTAACSGKWPEPRRIATSAACATARCWSSAAWCVAH